MTRLRSFNEYEQESSGSAGDGIIETSGVYSRENCGNQFVVNDSGSSGTGS